MTSSRKPAAKKTAPENRCRLVFVERGTNALFYMDWRPASEADKLLARGNRWLNTIIEIHEKYESVSLQFDWMPDAQPLQHLTPPDRLEEQMQRARGIKLDEAHWREVHQIEQHEKSDARRTKGADSTKARPAEFEAKLFDYLCHLIRGDKALAAGKNPQTALAKLVRTEQASEWCMENKNWNRVANSRTAKFYAERYVREKIVNALPEVRRALGIK